MIKKLFSVVLIAGTLSVNAQYTKLVDFALTTNGAEPLGSLIQASDGMLYGMTGYGGANTYGVIFQYNPATNTLIDKYDFNNANGGNPQGSLMQATDGMLYGTTSNGGANFDGVIFQYNPVT
ncbi:MAG TPA: choice-of-anchor tandem repeat GloVer-containing protein, partial [Bacteroidia bacterium]